MKKKNKLILAGVLLITVVMILSTISVMANTKNIDSISMKTTGYLPHASSNKMYVTAGRADILTEGFEEGIMPPTDWSVVVTNPGYTWTISTQNLHSGTYGADCVYDPALVPQDEWIISPGMDLSTYTEAYLSFWWMMSYYWGVDPNDNYDLNVYATIDDGTTWDLLWNEDSIGVFTNWEWIDTTFGNHIDLAAYLGESNVKIGFQYVGSDGAQMGIDDILVYGEGGQPTIPDLDCDGTLSWTEVTPGETVTGTFTVENIGDPDSLLDWEIESYPEWGNWTFTPSSGTDLTPEDDPVTVSVSVVAPDESETEFEGEVKIVNSQNASDFCIIDAHLATPMNQQPDSLVQRIFERFPNAFPILRNMLGL